ncbi:unnamed protein product [Linum tenue]|uniref:Uncharacterized protein n=1 Tax=Linum tenue TaxID=586396 RepID=A0AAV0N740_9ROSI|nr:unnamed protein product [Linum tenue]
MEVPNHWEPPPTRLGRPPPPAPLRPGPRTRARPDAGPGGGGGRSRAQVLPEGGSGGGGGHQQGDVLAVEPDHVPDGAGEGEGAGRWVSEDGGECFGGNGRIQGVGSLPFPEIPPGGDRV